MIEELKARISDVLMKDAFGLTTRTAVNRQAEKIVAAIGLDTESMIAEIDGEAVEFIRYVTTWEIR